MFFSGKHSFQSPTDWRLEHILRGGIDGATLAVNDNGTQTKEEEEKADAPVNDENNEPIPALGRQSKKMRSK